MNTFILNEKLANIDFEDRMVQSTLREILGCHLSTVNYNSYDVNGRQICRFCGNLSEGGKLALNNEEMFTAVNHGKGCSWAIAAELLGYKVYQK